MSATSDFRPVRPAASSPAPPLQSIGPTRAAEDVLVRSMRLKVLYSFDNDNKTNCLARWPNSVDVRTARLDENTQIGVIELKICIQAIVAASPELVAKLGQDYTVYAYDYSEYETPLVGQGMLSWVLASASSTPSAPAHQSRTIVTGRVCRNLLGLFSNDSQETLEVKLRLVPVPTSLQSEYIESLTKYRDLSQMMPQGFDPQAWTNFLQANPNFLQLANPSGGQPPAAGSGQPGICGIDNVQRLLSGIGSAPRSIEAQPALPRNNSFSNGDAAMQLPRPSSAASSVQSGAAPKRRGRPPGAKTSTRGRSTRAKKTETQQPSTNSGDPGYGSTDEKLDEGPNKKRAKIVQAEWSGKTDFGKQPDSLRVAASTAASVRIHQPTAVRPNNSLASSLEGPPREPTPIANVATRTQRPQLPQRQSNLRRESFAESKPYASPYVSAAGSIHPGESALTSPEASQAESSPVDIGSSPPAYHGASTVASSPTLPTLPRPFEDSGFMSGSIDDLFEDDEMRPIDDEDLEVAAGYMKRPNLPTTTMRPDREPQLPQATNSYDQASQEDLLETKAAAQKRQMAANARLLSRTASSGHLASPSVPASDPVRPTTLHRSQTWSVNETYHPRSDVAPAQPSIEGIQRPASRTRKCSENGTGAGAKRKQAIQSKLASSVAAGEMPPFCENCGAIETPTWRKAWVKIHSGTPEHVVISEEEGGIIACQILQTDQEGNVCLYRIIKKSILKTDEGFTEVLLCNPCGLWLHTRKCMRPKEVWEKPQNGGDGGRKRSGSGKDQITPLGSGAAATTTSERTTLYSNASSPASKGGQNDRVADEPQLPVSRHKRASSDRLTSPHSTGRFPNDVSAMAALQRAIDSSPHKFTGSEELPIEVKDLTPQPTRRILFPSPTQSQGPKSKHTSIASYERSNSKSRTSNKGLVNADKENCPPVEDENSELLFDEDPFLSTRSKTPTPTSSKQTMIFKTPVRSPGRLPPTTGDFFSSAAKALLRPPVTPNRTPTKGLQPLGEVTPFTAHLNQLLSDAHNSSPGQQGFDFPSLPSLRNTPAHASRAIDFDFSQLESQDLVSTDVPMPSSPPDWFGVYDDSNDDGGASLWGDYRLPSSGLTPKGHKGHAVGDEDLSNRSVDESRKASVDFQATA
ncbi:hypothetical protein ACLMJK_000926 [Lecanora helva]